MPLDVQQLGADIVETVRSFMAGALEPILKRLDAAEKSLGDRQDNALFVEAMTEKRLLEGERRADARLQTFLDCMKPKDGRDALALEDFLAEMADDCRTLMLSMRAGE